MVQNKSPHSYELCGTQQKKIKINELILNKKHETKGRRQILFIFVFIPISKSVECFYPFDTAGINVKRMKRQKEVEECEFYGERSMKI